MIGIIYTGETDDEMYKEYNKLKCLELNPAIFVEPLFEREFFKEICHVDTIENLLKSGYISYFQGIPITSTRQQIKDKGEQI